MRKLGVAAAETYLAVTNEWQVTSKIAQRLPTVKLTALINRLQDLRRVGLVESRMDVLNYRRLEWRRVPERPMTPSTRDIER